MEVKVSNGGGMRGGELVREKLGEIGYGRMVEGIEGGMERFGVEGGGKLKEGVRVDGELETCCRAGCKKGGD